MTSLFRTAFFYFLLLATLSGCSGSSGETELLPGDTLTTRSELLTLVRHSDRLVSAQVKNPWNEKEAPRLYLLADRVLPSDSIPEIDGAIVIKVPINSALVYSAIHAAVFDELGVPGLVTGVTDAPYFTFGSFPERIRRGKIKDIGNSMSPSLEAIVDLAPDVALVSPYQNAGHGVLDNTGIPIVEMADYMETTPLGRAEWVLFIGALTGKLATSQTIYDNVVANYESIRNTTRASSRRPLVVSELPLHGTWYLPGGRSYAATLIRDAGGEPVTDSDTSTGSLQLDESAAFELSSEADIWLLKTDHNVTSGEVRSSSPLANKVKAFRNGNIWFANTTLAPYFNDLAFHPERILHEYNAIFRGATDSLSYFNPVVPGL